MSSSYRDGLPSPNSPGAYPASWDPLGPGGSPGGTSTQPDWMPHVGQQFPPQQQPEPYPQAAHEPYQQQPAYPSAAWLAPVPVYPYAVWIRRVGAYLIDFAPAYVAIIPFWIGYVMLYVRLFQASASGDADAMLAGFSGTPLVLMAVSALLMLVAFGWQWYNRWLIAGRTGQSMGKRVLNTRLVAEINGQPIGPVNAFLRDLLHILDGIAYVGYLWPLWDAKRQTFADMIMKTVVVDRVQSGPSDTGHGQAPYGPA